jgi:UMF1 family MFS transporter
MTDEIARATTAPVEPVPRRRVFSWVLWDWATQPFNSVITTFVFSVYLTSDLFLPADVRALGRGDATYDRALAGLSSGLGLAITIAGVLIALLAPVLGRRSDGSGRRKLWLGIHTALVVVCMLALFVVSTETSKFVIGVALIAIANVFFELAAVNYNAMLSQVSTPASVGRISGLGWGFGYLGGIVMLLICYVGFIAGDAHLFGVTSAHGLNIRVIAVLCAAWAVLFAIPVLVSVPELPASPAIARVGILKSYAALIRDIGRLYRERRRTFWFLLASAVYRDGLAGVFTFGAIIASVTFGFSSSEVLIFGIAANVVAGISTILAGRLDDRVGPRAVILGSLVGLVIAGLAVFVLHDGGTVIFWIFGLALCAFVGPAQSSSRSFLSRVAPPGREGEIFGLYATTGRAASFLAPALWTLSISVFGAQFWGILGIVLVLAVGLVLMLFVKPEADARGLA